MPVGCAQPVHAPARSPIARPIAKRASCTGPPASASVRAQWRPGCSVFAASSIEQQPWVSRLQKSWDDRGCAGSASVSLPLRDLTAPVGYPHTRICDARIFDTTQRQNHSQAKMCVSRAMFYQATAFNQIIASWSTARVSNMNHDMKSVP